MTFKRYDTLVIGAGHNGLVCATCLARRGHRVLVLEASDTVGGLAATREFHPGFHAAVAHASASFAPQIAADLDLQAHGLQIHAAPLAQTGLGTDGNHVSINAGSVSGVSDADAAAYSRYCQSMQRFADALAPFWLRTMPRIGGSRGDMLTFARIGLKLRALGKRDMREFLRVVSLPTRDLMDEHFDNDILKAMLSWDGLAGLSQAPRSPNNSVLAMLYRMSGARVSGLVESLRSAAVAAGVEIRTGAYVHRIDIDERDTGPAATGVRLDVGEKIAADRVLSSADPQRTFLDLVGVENLEIGFTNRIRRLRCSGRVAKLHLALGELPAFSGIDVPDGRLFIAPALDALEFAFDDSKYGEFSRQPVMEIHVPSLHDTSLAPAGQHVLSANVMYVPHTLRQGWNPEARDALCRSIIDTIEQYAPGIRERILHAELLTPADLEKDWHVTGGHWHHTEFALDQLLMMRPTWEAAQYSTPVAGLFLCGAGCHPGGDLTGAPGHNAACEILR